MNQPLTSNARPPGYAALRRLGGRPQPLARLVMFPWCGAGASVYRKIGRLLPEHVEVFAVQLPGREDRFRDTMHLRMADVVAEVLSEVLRLCDRPLYFFGHSMGAVVAYETALALRRCIGHEPDALIVSGHAAPTGRKLHRQPWHTSDETQLLANIRRMGGTPPELLKDPWTMQMILRIMKADYEVLETHVPQPHPPLRCPLVACAGVDDREISVEGMQAWAQRSSGPHKLHWFDGDHFYLAAEPQTFAQKLQQWLNPAVLHALGTPPAMAVETEAAV